MTYKFKYINPVSFSGVKSGPHLLIIAGIHGDEYEPVLAVKHLIKMMKEKEINGRVTLVPVANSPAFQMACRTGPDGLDLARTCPGKEKGSITEKIAFEISHLIRQCDYFIDLHGGGNAFNIAPLAGYMLVPSVEVLSKQRMMAKAFGLPIVWGTSSDLNGRTLSVARDANIPAIYVEYGGGGSNDPRIIDAYVKGCLQVMISLKIREGKFDNSCMPHIVEDGREESGHLQRMLPAPADGIFEAKMKINSKVRKDDIVGEITDMSFKQLAVVRADEDGILFMLRAIPYVKKGDALGGILPVGQRGKISIL